MTTYDERRRLLRRAQEAESDTDRLLATIAPAIRIAVWLALRMAEAGERAWTGRASDLAHVAGIRMYRADGGQNSCDALQEALDTLLLCDGVRVLCECNQWTDLATVEFGDA